MPGRNWKLCSLKSWKISLATTRGRQQGDPKTSEIRPREVIGLSYFAAEDQPGAFFSYFLGLLGLSFLLGVLYCCTSDENKKARSAYVCIRLHIMRWTSRNRNRGNTILPTKGRMKQIDVQKGKEEEKIKEIKSKKARKTKTRKGIRKFLQVRKQRLGGCSTETKLPESATKERADAKKKRKRR